MESTRCALITSGLFEILPLYGDRSGALISCASGERRCGAQPDYESLAAALDNYAEPEEVA